jgi:predicted Rossmann fold nucleotide-binding protein DprA/Smf involved in DNA uptake
MKAVKKDLQSVIKNLKLLTEKAEKIARQLDKVENVQPAKKRTARPKNFAAKQKAPGTATETVLSIIKRQKKGIDTTALKKKTSLDTKTIRNVIFRLKKQGKIKSENRGIYMAV